MATWASGSGTASSSQSSQNADGIAAAHDVPANRSYGVLIPIAALQALGEALSTKGELEREMGLEPETFSLKAWTSMRRGFLRGRPSVACPVIVSSSAPIDRFQGLGLEPSLHEAAQVKVADPLTPTRRPAASNAITYHVYVVPGRGEATGTRFG